MNYAHYAGLLSRPWGRKPPNFAAFSTSTFCGGATYRPRNEVEPSPIKRFKSVSIFKRLDGEVVSTSSTVQKREGQTNGWLGSLVVGALDSQLDGCKFDSLPPRLGKLFTFMCLWQCLSVGLSTCLLVSVTVVSRAKKRLRISGCRLGCEFGWA